MTIDYTRTVYAITADDAARAVRHMAKRDGLRTRTTKSVRLEGFEEGMDPRYDQPRYTVTLAVDMVPALEVACD
jgi:hypothetical protein